MAKQQSDEALLAATRATFIAFIGSGLALASWAARIPQVRDRLELEPSSLGLVLLAIAVGSVLALPLSGPVVAKFGSRRVVRAMAVLLSSGLAIVAAGYELGLPFVVVGLFLVGFGNGAWDVAMNVQGALVEQHLGRSIMSRFHAGFSVGTVAGALIGAAMVALGVSVTVHLAVIAAATCFAIPVAVQGFIPDASELKPRDRDLSTSFDSGLSVDRRGQFAAWLEPRTLLIGVFVMAFAFAEGAGNDWISVAVIDDHGLSPAIGTLAFAAFLAAMTLGRWFGPTLLDRYGRVAVVRFLALTGVVGTVLFVTAPLPAVVFLGVLLWGFGTSLGFPVGMSAGADDPRYAAGRVSVIASIGYCAFLAGPPFIGFLGDRVTVLRAVIVVAVVLGTAILIAAVVQPKTPSEPLSAGAPTPKGLE